MAEPRSLTAFALNCSLKASGAGDPSPTDKMIADLLAALARHGVTGHPRESGDPYTSCFRFPLPRK
jgi:hypothetical protein